MLQLKPNVTPIGGWLFIDSPISADTLQDWSEDSLVNQVVARRQQNPRFNLTTDRTAVRAEVESQNAQRLSSMLKTPLERSSYLIESGPPDPSPSFPVPHRPAPGGAVRVAGRAVAGVKVMLDWLGSGLKPVDGPVAEARAQVCVKCPQNQEGNFFQRIEGEVAARIKKTVELKNSMKLQTTVDDKLQSCESCSCWMPLKVWVPMEHIKSHDTPEVLAKLDKNCWVLAELKK